MPAIEPANRTRVNQEPPAAFVLQIAERRKVAGSDMILDKVKDKWRATFCPDRGTSPRVEVFHRERGRSLEIARACEAYLRKAFPDDFAGETEPNERRETC